MKNKIIDVAGYGHSGKGILTDFFKEFNKVTVHDSLFEFNLLRIQGGLIDLKHNLVDNWSPIRSDSSIKRFKNVIKSLGTNSDIFQPKSLFISTGNNYNSFLPTIRIQQFSDSFKGFTFMVEKKVGNELKNVFIHDDANTLKNLTSDSSTTKSTTIVAQNGIVQEKQMILFDGQILTSKKNNLENDVVKFQQLNIDLKNLQTSTIKVPKLQETSTIDLIKCLSSPTNYKTLNCAVDTKKEIITVLNRRISLPFYIPIVALLCSFLLIKSQKKVNFKRFHLVYLHLTIKVIYRIEGRNTASLFLDYSK